jgi:hypothetical protein
MTKPKYVIGAIALAALLTAASPGCTSDADTAAQNLSTKAEKFEVQRKITVVNTRSDKVVFEVTGRCSIEFESKERVMAMCKHGDDDFRKHYAVTGDTGMAMIEQLGPIDVDEYHTQIVIKPETIIPDFDLETSGDIEGDG